MTNGLPKLLALAAEQRACFTRDQWRACDLSDARLARCLRAGWVVQVHQRVYRLAGSTTDWSQRVRAATLIAPGRVFAGGRTALALHGVVTERDPRPHVTIDHRLRYRFDRRILVVHTSRTLQHDVARASRGTPTVSVDRSLFEVGMTGPDRNWLDLVGEAARRGLVTPESMGTTLESMGPIPHRRRMRDLLSTLDARFLQANSVPELTLLQIVERITRHPCVLNHPVADGDGLIIARVDVAAPELCLGFEGDSIRWHGAGPRQDHDRRRDHRYDQVGWTVGRVMLSWLRTDPALVESVVREKLELALERRDKRQPPTSRAGA